MDIFLHFLFPHFEIPYILQIDPTSAECGSVERCLVLGRQFPSWTASFLLLFCQKFLHQQCCYRQWISFFQTDLSWGALEMRQSNSQLSLILSHILTSLPSSSGCFNHLSTFHFDHHYNILLLFHFHLHSSCTIWSWLTHFKILKFCFTSFIYCLCFFYLICLLSPFN